MRRKLLQRRLLMEPGIRLPLMRGAGEAESIAAADRRLAEDAASATDDTEVFAKAYQKSATEIEVAMTAEEGEEAATIAEKDVAKVTQDPARLLQPPWPGSSSPSARARARAYAVPSWSTTASRYPGTPRGEQTPLPQKSSRSQHNLPAATVPDELHERLQQRLSQVAAGFTDPLPPGRSRSRTGSDYDPDRITCVIPQFAEPETVEDNELELALHRRRQEVEESAATFTKEGSSSSADVAWSR